jgi:phosphoesterase RecJ-like protein
VLQDMPGANRVLQNTERRDFDLAVVCDAGALERVGTSLLPVVNAVPLLIDIDHHVVIGSTFGDIQLLDAKAAATAELIWQVVVALSKATGRELASQAVAQCLMIGLVTDTGSFGYPNVRPETLRLAATLQELGAPAAPIVEQIYATHSYANQKLLGAALHSLQRSEDGRAAWALLRVSDFEAAGATDEDTEGIVNQVLGIEGVRIGVLFREIAGKKIRVSLRGREGVSVNEVAAKFGGGGHHLAAGCSIEPPIEDAVSALVAEAERHLSEKAVPL